VRPHLLAAATVLALAACGHQAAPVTTVAAPPPPHLTTHADRVLVAGDSTVLTTPTGAFRITVTGPATQQLPTFRALRVGQLHDYLATFRVTVQQLRGSQRLGPADFRLLAIADQAAGGAIRTTAARTTTLTARTLTSGTWAGTWTAPFPEGHGELLFTPSGATRPAALWDFRVES